MRAGVYGREFIMKNGTCIGVNIGYNFFREHEVGIESVLDNLIYSCNRREVKRWRRKIEKKYKRVSIGGKEVSSNIIPPCCGYLRSEIIIDNSELSSNVLLKNGEYTLQMFGDSENCSYINSRIGQKRKFNEGMFFYLGDYKYSGINILGVLAGAWAGNYAGVDSDIIVLTPKGFIADDMEQSFKQGDLALFDGISGVTKDRGCTLLMLDNKKGV